MLGVEEKGGYAFVEAEAVPATVGYPRFCFVLKPGTMVEVETVACYCLDKGKWSLLFTSPGMAEDWKRLA